MTPEQRDEIRTTLFHGCFLHESQIDQAVVALAPIIARLVAEEAERCAKVADEARIEWEKALIICGENVVIQSLIAAAETIAAAIRARGESRE